MFFFSLIEFLGLIWVVFFLRFLARVYVLRINLGWRRAFNALPRGLDQVWLVSLWDFVSGYSFPLYGILSVSEWMNQKLRFHFIS